MLRLRTLYLGLALLPSALGAQGNVVTRRDLADAYLTIDRLVTTQGIPAAQRADWNRDFDRTTLAFFGGDFSRVLRQMHDLTARIVGDSAAASPSRQLLALRLRSEPRVLAPEDTTFELSVTLTYADSSVRGARRITVRVLDAANRARFRQELVVPADAAAGSIHRLRVVRSALPLEVGSYRVEAALEGAALTLTTPLYVLGSRAAATRADLEARIDRAVQRGGAGVDAQVLASLRARLALLSDAPDESNSAQFLADQVRLSSALRDEVAAVEAGRDPYGGSGDFWRVLKMPNGLVPLRSYVPPQARAGAARPVVIALHGAGADENMFLEGYGAGTLRALADSAGFVLLSPNTTAFVREPGTLDSALALLERSANIDRARVYLVGHSMGAAAAIRLGVESREQVRAIVALAGTGVLPAGASIPPTQFIAAETDLVIPVTRVRVTYDQFRAANQPVEYRVASGWGHTLMVGAHLESALRWLLQR